MKKYIFFIFLIIVFLAFPLISYASYDPLSKPNNKFGIHILFTEEISEAATLINSNGGDWGYVTIPIMASDRDLAKWQQFMDNCRKYHLIPIVRLATDGDYFSKTSWSIPTDYDVLSFANFLNSLSWPTKNRYVVVFNETNRSDEWGGSPDASQYAEILDYATQVFKQRNSDFFIISAGLDNASINIPGQSVDQFTFMRQMDEALPGIFSELDGLGAHAYPNPAFSSPPSQSSIGIDSFYYQKNLADELSGKELPVFITETGWSSDSVSYDIQNQYYIQAFNNYWNDKDVIAVTPFIFHADQGPFAQFAFVKNNNPTPIYANYKNFPKIKGEPELTENYSFLKTNSTKSLPTIRFNVNESINSVFKEINKSSEIFFKWLLKA